MILELTTYADDTTLFVKDGQSLKRVCKVMKKFQGFSSLRQTSKNLKLAG